MSFEGNLPVQCIQIGAEARTKSELLREIAGLALRHPALKSQSEEQIFQGLEAREKIGSTGFGGSIAIPHCGMKEIDDFAVGALIVPAGIDFDAMDGKKTKVFFFIVGPSEQRNRHIRILSSISKFLKDSGNVESLIKAGTPEEVRSLILQDVTPSVDLPEGGRRSMITIFVQQEEYFEDILEILSSEVEGAISVLETKNAGHYLHRLPLFSAFWSEENSSFSRVIFTVVEKGLTNDVIRRIHSLIENFEEGGVLITVSDLYYSSGSINF